MISPSFTASLRSLPAGRAFPVNFRTLLSHG